VAAHLKKKLTKSFVIEIDISENVKTLLDPKIPLSIRLSGQLLLGLVHVYSRKAKYLQDDCSSAMIAAKVALRPKASIDLPSTKEANSSSITLAEDYDDLLLDLEFEDVTLDDLEVLKRNVARHVDITQESKALPKSLNDSESDVEQQRKADASVDIDFDINLGLEAEGFLDFDAEQRPEDHDQTSLINFEDPNETLFEAAQDPKEAEDLLDVDLPPEVLPYDHAIEEVKIVRPKKRNRRVAAMDEVIEVPSKAIRARLADHQIPKRGTQVAEMVRCPKRARNDKYAKSPFAFYLGDEIAATLRRKISNQIKKAVRKSSMEADGGLSEKAPDQMDESELKHRHDDLDADHLLLEQSFQEVPATLDVDAAASLESKEGEDETADSESAQADRMLKMYHFVRRQMGDREETSFKELVGPASRKAAAGIFHELLVLKTRGVLNVCQEEPYGTIILNKTERFEDGV